MLKQKDAEWYIQHMTNKRRSSIHQFKAERIQLKEKLAREYGHTISDTLCEDLAKIAAESGGTELEKLEREHSFLAKSRNELREIEERLYLENNPPDLDVCRMLGTVNGRNDFELKKGLHWG